MRAWSAGARWAINALVAHLNASHLDWLFTRDVVVSVLVALQANWMADYRNSSGIVLDDGSCGRDGVLLEDSSRVDPWLVRQAQREAAECREALAEFARRDRPVHAAAERHAPVPGARDAPSATRHPARDRASIPRSSASWRRRATTSRARSAAATWSASGAMSRRSSWS